MKSGRTIFAHGRIIVWLALLAPCLQGAADFNVASPGFLFNINGQSPNPTLTLVRGRTYVFTVTNASFHPFHIVAAGTFSNNVNNISSGVIIYTVATNAPATIDPGYRCSIHGFSGIIQTVAPSAPPTPAIVGYQFGSNSLVLRSTGTNSFTVTPEFKTNLNSTNWFALTVQSNRFAGGTNETFCGRPPGTNVFIRVKVQ
jgi:hypothetical protein